MENKETLSSKIDDTNISSDDCFDSTLEETNNKVLDLIFSDELKDMGKYSLKDTEYKGFM